MGEGRNRVKKNGNSPFDIMTKGHRNASEIPSFETKTHQRFIEATYIAGQDFLGVQDSEVRHFNQIAALQFLREAFETKVFGPHQLEGAVDCVIPLLRAFALTLTFGSLLNPKLRAREKDEANREPFHWLNEREDFRHVYAMVGVGCYRR